MRALELVRAWPVRHAAGAVITPDGVVHHVGDIDHRFRLASLAKMLVGWTALVAVEEGTLDLDDPLTSIGATPVDGCTPRHLLSHAGGFAFDSSDRLAPPGTRRIYSNTGIELFTELLAARAGIPYSDYQREAVLEPLGMSATELDGSPAKDVWSTTRDMVAFLRELRSPRLVTVETAAQFSTVQFAGLAGTVPGIGRYDDCPWGLGTEIRGGKRPHWTGGHNSAATYGHFGGAGTLLWVDPVAMTSCVVLTDRPFDDWAVEALRCWPELSDAVLAEAALAVTGDA